MNFGRNVCLDESLDEFENGSCQVKIRSLDQMFKEPCVHSRGHIFSLIIMKLDQHVCLDEMFVLMKSRTSLKMGRVD